MTRSLSFRWLGVAGLEFTAGEHVLAIDPFFSRPPLRFLFAGRPQPDSRLAAERMPRCDHILVTHAHWDHIMDVPDLIQHTGAAVYGSANTQAILTLHGADPNRVYRIAVGDRLVLGPFDVRVLRSEHPCIPFFEPQPLRSSLRLPVRLRDYRMDECFGFGITANGIRLLVSPANGSPSDALFIGLPVALRAQDELLLESLPRLVVPIHWDNPFQPLSSPQDSFKLPGAIGLKAYQARVRRLLPGTRFAVPEMFHTYPLMDLTVPALEDRPGCG